MKPLNLGVVAADGVGELGGACDGGGGDEGGA